MNKLLITVLMLFSGIVPCTAQQYGWIDISGNVPKFPYDTTIINNGEDTILANYHGLCFISDNEGWISTYHPFEDSAAILHTVDGGVSWEVQMVETPIVAIEMLSATEGYAAAYGGTIYHTANGGNTWEYHGSTFALSLSDMDFPPGSDTGYVCGQNGAVSRITPTGVEPMITGIISDMKAIQFISPDHGWMCGQSIVKEYKHGEWVAGHSYPSGIWHDIFFTDTLNGWGVGFWLAPHDSIIIAHTVNDADWMPNLSNMGDCALYSIFFLDQMRGWVTGASGEIYSTINGGQSWAREAEGMADDFLARIQFTSPSNGYTCGNNLKILKYTQINGVEEQGDGKEGKRGNMDVWPNPTPGTFKVHSTRYKSKWCEIELHDAFGRNVMKLFSGIFPDTGVELNVSALPAGIYFVWISDGGFCTVQKLVKQ